MNEVNHKHPGKACPLPTEESIKQLFVESESTTNLIYVFPKRLVACFRSAEKSFAPSLLDEESVERELELSILMDTHGQVAFRQKLPSAKMSFVKFRFLGDAPGPVTLEYLQKAGSENPEQAVEEINAVFESHYRLAQAYCGWLLQQETYWRDLKTVIGLFGDQFENGMLPQQVFTEPDGAVLVEEEAVAAHAFKTFCEKWRLQGMATLDLPIVIEPQLTPVTLYTPNSHPSSVTPFLPDIFPVSSKGALAMSLEQSRVGIEAPHLDEWKSLIATSSRKKKEIAPYARRFCLQHYWRTLLQRYPKQTRKRKEEIAEAFGRYFGVASRVISRDAQEMAILIDRKLSALL